jgi:hypothetical protein
MHAQEVGPTMACNFYTTNLLMDNDSLYYQSSLNTYNHIDSDYTSNCVIDI